MKKIILLNIIFASFYISVNAQVLPTPAEKQSEPIALMGGTVHTATGEIIENGVIAFENGIINYVGVKDNFEGQSQHYKKIDVTGKSIYPGLILADSDLGLVEVNSVDGTVDNAEMETLNPNLRSIIAYNTDSHIIPTIRTNGILVAQIAPNGGIFSGTSSIVQLDAWNWEDATLKIDDGIHLQWPEEYDISGSFKGSDFSKNTKYNEQLQQTEKLLADAKAWYEEGTHEKINLKLKSLEGLFDRSKQLFIHVNINTDIVRSVMMAQKYSIKKIVVVGGNDTYYVKDFLRENNIPVILDGIHENSYRTHEDVDLSYKLPAILHKAGIKVGIAYSEQMIARSRNLPFNAGTAAAYGLTKEEALQLITKNIAEILGIDDRLGTLEKGKEAMIVVSEGDILDMRTNKIILAFIQGREINLTNKNLELYERFLKKYNSKL
jgi:hypothetical protein